MATLWQKAYNLLRSKSPTSKYRIVYFGDSWFDWGKTRAKAITRYQIFVGALETAAKQKPLLILIGGDGVFSGTDAQLQYFSQTVTQFMDKYKIPVFMLPGNHERNGVRGSLALYQKYISARLNYKIDVPNLRIIMLNDIGPAGTLTRPNTNSYYGFQDSKSLGMLQHFLKTTPANSKVVITMHAPPQSNNWQRPPLPPLNLTPEDGFVTSKPKNKAFLSTLQKYKSKIQKVLVSHVHTYATNVIGGIPYVLNGSGGAVIGHNRITVFTVTKGIVSKPKVIPITRSKKTPNKVFVGSSVLPNP